MTAPVKQHLIDPAVCIRCNTCEATCPVGAITHDANNYVVDIEKCEFCMDCVSPCPTGSINHFVFVQKPYSLAEQLEWMDLPPEDAPAQSADVSAGSLEAIDDEAAALIEDAHSGSGGRVRAPGSASQPRINLFNRTNAAKTVVTGNLRLTAPDAVSDVRHVILDFGKATFPIIEGQSIGIIPPGMDALGRPHTMRLYSVASPRDGERPNTNNLAITVKRVAEPQVDGAIHPASPRITCATSSRAMRCRSRGRSVPPSSCRTIPRPTSS